jgi:hypothetical protein
MTRPGFEPCPGLAQVVLHGRETWSITLTKEHRVRGFENRIVRKIFGGKWDEVIRE